LAPEQARGEVADARTDVYTLAIVLWELLTGQQYLPISGLDPGAGMALVRHPKPMPPSSRAPWIAPELDKVVLRALAPDRGQRTQSAEEFRLALSDVIAQVAPRTDPARVVELMQAIFQDVIDSERAERDHFLKEVIPIFRESVPEPVAKEKTTPLPLQSLAAAEGRVVSQSDSYKSAAAQAKRRPTIGGQVEEEKDEDDSGARLPGVTPAPDSAERRRARREAAMRVLAELAAEDSGTTPGAETARK
jgi:serine/threonine-protein kinase